VSAPARGESAEPATPVASDAPIFVIGCGRSGTTLLRMILDSHPRISCGEETKFLIDLQSIVTRYWGLLSTYGLERAFWIDHIRRLYLDFQGAYLERRGKARWADKTPTYTPHLPFIDELFPTAQYVHLLRDGHDVVASHRERWGWRAGARAANSIWVSYVRAARAFGARLPPGRFHELRYEDLVTTPEPTARALFAFLCEDWDPAVLQYQEQAHDTTERHAQFTQARRAESGEQATIYRSRVGAGKASLDPALHRLLHLRAGELLAELGYGDG
jgi:hypothetical protein